jgi:hypothetical protein
MRAIQEGRLSLDANINTYLPFRVVNPHHPDAPITLRDLPALYHGSLARYRFLYASADENHTRS